MVTFDNAIPAAQQIIEKELDQQTIDAVTIIRDVIGKLSLLIEPSLPAELTIVLKSKLTEKLGNHFSGNIYFTVCDNSPIVAQMIKKIQGERLQLLDIDIGGVIWYQLERPIAKKAWIENKNLATPVWPKEQADSGTAPKVVSFYSFKGGMGRSTALAAVTLNLSKQGKNVVIVDTDIEAPGVATLFFDEDRIHQGVIDFFIEHPLSKSINLRPYIVPVNEPMLLPADSGRIYVVPAGKVTENYLQKLARIDYQDNRPDYMRNTLCALLQLIRNEIPNADYILVDARAGFHDMGGVALAQLPHAAVLFGNSSRQSWEGVKLAVSVIAQSQYEQIPAVIVDAMCSDTLDEMFESESDAFKQKSYEVFVDTYYRDDEPQPGVYAEEEPHSPVFIPFNKALKNDVILFSNGDANSTFKMKAYAQELLRSPYAALTSRIQKIFGDDDNGYR